MRIDVVEENPHAHAAVGCGDELIGKEPARQIAVPDVVHQVEAAPGATRCQPPRREGVEIFRKHGKATLSRRPRGEVGGPAVERRLTFDGRQGQRNLSPRPPGEAPVGIGGKERRGREHKHAETDEEQETHAFASAAVTA